ncbi:MAG: hypothetical protein SFV51_11135 [Bryobacteraceae bacterium]|nr:hypothetical protein [Bryobacteraceae bacterium]
MRTPAILAVFAASTLFGQYKTEANAALPADASAFGSVLEKAGVKVLGADGKTFCEIWLRSSAPAAGGVAEEGITLTGVAHGALIGVIHFPAKGADRRGQPVNPGVYTLRLSFHPVNGDHQGVAPQRDFLVLTPVAIDTDPAATPDFETLMKWSRKASGTPHPAVLSMWKVDDGFQAGFSKMGEDWVLQAKSAGTPIAIILIGKAEG